MKDKENANFWFGFFLAAVVTAWLYWLWRRNREVLPDPVIVTRKSVTGRVDDLVESSPQDETRIQLQPAKKADTEVRESDPLETIDGIGPIYKRRLHDAGIYTFAQLANTSPDALQEITGVTRWDPAGWISEARQLLEEN